MEKEEKEEDKDEKSGIAKADISNYYASWNY